MNAGLSNLGSLKAFILPDTMQKDKRFDAAITAIGLGMAALFDSYLNRKLAWMDGDTVIFSGDRPQYYLPRFPFAVITKVEMRYFRADAWTEITDQPISTNPETGKVEFGYTLGRPPLQVRATWSGGYWFETLDEGDEGYPSAAPAATNTADIEARKFLLPDDIRTAFFLQCQQIWDARDKLGISVVDKPGNQMDAARLAFSPIVKDMLQPHKRFQLT